MNLDGNLDIVHSTRDYNSGYHGSHIAINDGMGKFESIENSKLPNKPDPGYNNYDYFIAQKTTLFSYPFLINLGTSLYLFLTNFLGLLSINTKFKTYFRNTFLFILIPLIPLMSYWTHHRYFLAYSLFTNACLPFLFEKNKNLKN